jgi:hypothetical protein
VEKVSQKPSSPTKDPEPGVPEAVEADGDTNTPFVALDERAFMLEVCERLNNFIRTYPQESRNLLAKFLPYENELKWVHEQIVGPDKPAGAQVAALFGGIFQTQHGTGWVLHPVVDTRPGKSFGYLLRFEVRRQDPPEDWPMESV